MRKFLHISIWCFVFYEDVIGMKFKEFFSNFSLRKIKKC